MWFGRPERTPAASISSNLTNRPSRRNLYREPFLVHSQAISLRGLEPGRAQLFDNGFLDVAKLVLAEEHFTPDKKGRRAEGAALDGVRGVFDQSFLDVILARTGDQAVDIDAGRGESASENLWIVHLLRLFPHVMVGRAEVRLEHTFEMRHHRATHQRQGIERKKGIRFETRDVVAGDEAAGFQRLG